MKTECGNCNGTGLIIDHDRSDTRPEHFNDGDCHTCPQQYQCEMCYGEGVLQAISE